VKSAGKNASKAVDGLYLPSQHGLTEHHYVAVTNVEKSPWIQVDLAISHYIYGVKIWQRSECADSSEYK